MSIRTKLTVGAVAVALAMGAAGAGPAVAAEPSPQRATPTVDRPTPDEVRADVAAGERVTIGAAIAEPDGGLRIESVEVVGPEQALAAMESFAATRGALSTSVSAPTVTFGFDPVRFAQYASDMLCIDAIAETGNPSCSGYLWGPDANDGGATGKNQIIAVVDSGVNTEHPELQPLIVPGASCMGGDCVAKSSTAPADRGDHGSAVAGIANVVTGNGVGLAGVASGVKIMPVQVFPPNGGGLTVDMARGITWAVDHGATVINVSAGTEGTDNEVLGTAVAYAISQKIPVVAAAGNSGTLAKTTYPAAYPDVIGVGAVDKAKVIWADTDSSGSSQGPWVDVVAPGKLVPGIKQGNDPYKPFDEVNPGYVTWTGTSMASPITAAIVAAMREKFPNETPAQLGNRLQVTAQDLGASGRDNTYGYGLLQPLKALALPAAPTGLSVFPGNANATIAFTAPKPPAGYPVTKYQYAKDTGSGFGSWTDIPNGRTSSPVTVEGLPNDQSTKIKIRAVNAVGAGTESALVTTTPAVPVKTQFTPIEPARVFDSRWPEITGIDTGPLSPGADPQGRKISVKDGRNKDGVVPGKENVVPVGATAVAFNITVAGQTASGYASVAPGSVTTPPGASTINWSGAGQTMANGFVSGIDGNRDLRVHVGSRGETAAIVDIVGYYSPQAAPSGPSSNAVALADSQSVFVPISPTRVYQSTKFGGDGKLFNSKGDYKARPVQVAKAIDNAGLPTGPDMVPAGATGIAYNVTITGTSGSGYLAIAPGDKLNSAPAVSVINWSGLNQTQANATVVGIGPINADGDRGIGVFPAPSDNGGYTHFIIDVVGYFIPKAQDTTAKGAEFVAIPPMRAYSSIVAGGQLPGGSNRVTSVGLDKGIPTGASAVAFNLTITGSEASGYLSVTPGDNATDPTTSTINWSGSVTKANGSMVGVDTSRQVKTYAGGRSPAKTHYLLDIAGYYIK